MNDKVVWLDQYRQQDRVEEIKHPTNDRPPLYVLACNNCSNKTFALIYADGVDGFPKLQCCICGQAHGHVGWADLETS